MIMLNSKLRVLLLADVRGWAFDSIAQATKKHISKDFDVDIAYSREDPLFDDAAYDIIHVLWGKEDLYRKHLHGNARVIKSVYSHAWIEEDYARYLEEADLITVPSLLLFEALQHCGSPVLLVPEGVDTEMFSPESRREGSLVVGWAGKSQRALKRFDWVQKACEGFCELKVADNDRSNREMPDFYNRIDIIACSSVAEGAPRTLLEGMACGAFPVSFPVGIAPELIAHKTNGFLIEEESIDGIRAALCWCKEHTDHIRSMKTLNASAIQQKRSWKAVLPALHHAYMHCTLTTV